MRHSKCLRHVDDAVAQTGGAGGDDESATADDVPPITARLEFPAAHPLGCDAASYALLPLALIAPFGALPILFSGLFAAIKYKTEEERQRAHNAAWGTKYLQPQQLLRRHLDHEVIHLGKDALQRAQHMQLGTFHVDLDQ